MIEAGTTSSTGSVTIRAHRDADTDADSVVVSGSAANAEGVTDPSPLTVPINEEPEAGVTIRPATITFSEGGSGIYTVGLDRQPLGDVVIRLSVRGNSDVSVDTDLQRDGNQNTLTFTPDDYKSQVVTVRAAEDDDAANDTATIIHTLLASAVAQTSTTGSRSTP